MLSLAPCISSFLHNLFHQDLALLSGLESMELKALAGILAGLVADIGLVDPGLVAVDCRENIYHYPGTCLEGRFLAGVDS